MSAAKELLEKVLALPKRERVTLAAKLLETLDDGEPVDPNVEQQWAQEAERRIKEIEAGAVGTVTWEELRAELIRRESKGGDSTWSARLSSSS